MDVLFKSVDVCALREEDMGLEPALSTTEQSFNSVCTQPGDTSSIGFIPIILSGGSVATMSSMNAMISALFTGGALWKLRGVSRSSTQQHSGSTCQPCCIPRADSTACLRGPIPRIVVGSKRPSLCAVSLPRIVAFAERGSPYPPHVQHEVDCCHGSESS